MSVGSTHHTSFFPLSSYLFTFLKAGGQHNKFISPCKSTSQITTVDVEATRLRNGIPSSSGGIYFIVIYEKEEEVEGSSSASIFPIATKSLQN